MQPPSVGTHILPSGSPPQFQSQQEVAPHPTTVPPEGDRCLLVEMGLSEIPQPLPDYFGLPTPDEENRGRFCERITTILEALQNSEVLNPEEKTSFTHLPADSLFTNQTDLYLVLDIAYKHSLVASFLEKVPFPNNATLVQKVALVRTHIRENKGEITKLDCYSKNMLCLPKELCTSLSSLRKLDLGNNQLSSLPDSLGNLSALQMLDLSDNQLPSLPDSFGTLSALDELYLQNNQLSSLPDSFGTLSLLRVLDLSNNQLPSLPDFLGNLSSLQWLNLENNPLSSLPDSLGNLSALQRLYLENSHLSSLPDSFGKLFALQTLDLSNNQLSSLPDSLGNLSSLIELCLQNNQLSSLPESFGALSALRALFLGNNQLFSLPDSFENFSSLQKLDLSNNYLSSLPESLKIFFEQKGFDPDAVLSTQSQK